MTPKEKAKELVNRFAKLPEEGSLMWYLSFEIAKKCALIAVDEILDTIKWCIGDSQVEYWEDVKTQIELL
jgi:hypothetical protein